MWVHAAGRGSAAQIVLMIKYVKLYFVICGIRNSVAERRCRRTWSSFDRQFDLCLPLLGLRFPDAHCLPPQRTH